VGRVGRPGAGPGEFRYLTSILRLEGDSILTFDQVLWRISVFAPSRLLAREVSLTPIAASLEFVALPPDGRHLLANRRRTFREVARPPILPAFGSLHLDPHGNLLATEWTSSFAAPDQAARRWWAFDREGVLLGEITAPAAFRMHEIGDDYVLGVTSDELGVERIAMFPLVRAE
jgi:hypothetical protein